MDQYGAHILATTRQAEFMAAAAASRLAAATREQPDDPRPATVAGKGFRTPRPAMA
jgi:hypothetical protein